MKDHLLERVDTLIDQFKKDHHGEAPLYIVVSPEENEKLMALIREKNNYTEDQVVTEYGKSKIATHPQLNKGNIYVSNELPETGS